MSWNAKRYTDRNRHHLIPRSPGGDNALSNLLLIRIDRHVYWHKIFGTATLEEVLELLTRMKRMKERQRYAVLPKMSGRNRAA